MPADRFARRPLRERVELLRREAQFSSNVTMLEADALAAALLVAVEALGRIGGDVAADALRRMEEF